MLSYLAFGMQGEGLLCQACIFQAIGPAFDPLREARPDNFKASPDQASPDQAQPDKGLATHWAPALHWIYTATRQGKPCLSRSGLRNGKNVKQA